MVVSVDAYDVWVGQARVSVTRYQPARRDRRHEQMVFLHGWGTSPYGYRNGLQALASRGVPVDAFSLPGYGGSTPLPVRGSGIAAQARHVATAIEEAGFPGPVHLSGHSLGGGLALRIASAHPHLVSRVTAICPIGGAAGGCAPWPRMLSSWVTETGSLGLGQFLVSFGSAVRRSALSVALTGWAARHAHLVPDLVTAIEHGIDVHLVLADRESVVPAGPLATTHPVARVTVVAGGHNWPHTNPQGWAELALASA